MTALPDALPADHIVKAKQNRPQMWVQEAMFGHRFYEEQKPFMLVLEALAVCRARMSSTDVPGGAPRPIFPGLPSDGTHEAVQVAVPKMGELRLMIFRGQGLEAIERDGRLGDDERLSRYVEELNGDAAKLLGNPKAFDYLRARFKGRFCEFALAVRLLRGLEVDALSQRRWSSRFLVPRGPHLQVGDLDESLSTDRRFFGRGGELVYLMLNRSRLADAVGERITASFLAADDPLDHLARSLSPDKDETSSAVDVGYLPRRDAAAYDRLAEDWLAVLDLARLPAAQKLDPLSRLTALNLVRYVAEGAATIVGASADPLPLDMLDGGRGDLRSLSRTYFERSRSNVHDAVAIHVRAVLNTRDDWRNACAAPALVDRSDLARAAIAEAFHAKGWEAATPVGTREPEEWMDVFVEEAKARSRNDVSGVIKPLAEGAGLATSRQKVGSWWRATDEILDALVLANVVDAMTIEDLAARLHARYGLVIGPTEAQVAFPVRSFDITSFEENARAFERRLTGLGYVKRLSDDCAFVSNPYRKGASP